MSKLSDISLETLHIMKQNMFQTLQKYERIMGNSFGCLDGPPAFEAKEYSSYVNAYKILEDEMNQRIFDILQS